MTAISPITKSFSKVRPKDTGSGYRARYAELVAGRELDWKYTEAFITERDDIAILRENSAELGIDAVSAATGAQLALVAAAASPESIVEIGTGLGVSGLWLMSGAPEASFTSIDSEADYQQVAKAALIEAGIAPNRVRLITGAASQVLPRMNDASYDLVFVDADPESVIEYVEHGIRLARTGGVILVAHALWRGKVADPAQRDEPVGAFRSLLGMLSESSAVTAALSPVGDGLLQLVKK
jgi:predicted O-methyltransferase YrrM